MYFILWPALLIYFPATYKWEVCRWIGGCIRKLCALGSPKPVGTGGEGTLKRAIPPFPGVEYLVVDINKRLSNIVFHHFEAVTGSWSHTN